MSEVKNYQGQPGALFEENYESQGCLNCNNPTIEEGYHMALCTNCRNNLSKRALPAWLKIMMLIVLIILFIALKKFPDTIEAGISFEQALKAEKEGKYVTAMRGYEKVVKSYPDSTLALAKLFITEYNNGKIYEADQTLQKIVGRKPSNQELVDKVNHIIERMETLYFWEQEFYELMENNQKSGPEKTIKELRGFITKKPDDVWAAYYLANLLYDIEEYNEAETIIKKVLDSNQDFMEGHLFLAAIYREKKQFEEAIHCCNKVLSNNLEHPWAYVSLSKIELKRYNDNKGLEYAQKAYELESSESSIVANLALAYHFNNLIKERDEAFTIFKNFNDNNVYDLELLDKIFNKNFKWRE